MRNLTATLLAALVAFGAWAETETVDGIEWIYDVYNGEASIWGTGIILGNVTVPSVLGGKPVTAIHWVSHDSRSRLTGVTIPDSVKYISSGVFEWCDDLTYVKIGKGVSSIGSECFHGCSKLTRVTMSGVASIGNEAFYGCSKLTRVTMSGVTSIGNKAFYGCSKLKYVSIGKKTSKGSNAETIIGDFAFYECGRLTSIVIPNGVKSIGDSAFYGCGKLTSIMLPGSLKSIGDSAFSGCSRLASITLPSSLKSIGDSAFSGCSRLENASLPSSVRSIGSYAFHGCSSLFRVTIPKDVKSIGDGAFSNCSGLNTVSVQSSAVNGFNDCANLVNVSLSGNSKVIFGYAFSGCTSLTNITIPGSVKTIFGGAFSNCSSLKRVVVENGVSVVGGGAFAECYNIRSIALPKSVKGIGYGAFDLPTCHDDCDDNDFGPDLSVYVSSGDTERVRGLLTDSINNPRSVFRFGLAKTVRFIEMPWLTVKSTSVNCGTVRGGGVYNTEDAATLEAAANNGYVFAGWFTDKACTKALNPKGYDNRKPTVKVAMPAKDTTIYAKFISKKEDKSALKFKSATKKLAKTPAKATAGAAFSLKLGVSSASLPTFTAKGLPKGLSIDKTTGEITGVGTVPGSYTATVTVKSAAGNKITQTVKITVNVPSWAKGTFYGLTGIKSEGSWAYVKFSVGATGKVTGKVTYKGKGYSFTSAYKSCTATKAKFAPKVKVGSYTLKPGTVTVRKLTMDGLATTEALASGGGGLYAQKKPNLVKKGKPLAALVGETFKFTKKDANSGLTKSKDKLEVVLGNGDVATVSGTVKGKALKALSWAVLVSDKETADGVTTYTLYVDIIDAALKYERTLVLQVYFDNDGQLRVYAKFQ